VSVAHAQFTGNMKGLGLVGCDPREGSFGKFVVCRKEVSHC